MQCPRRNSCIALSSSRSSRNFSLEMKVLWLFERINDGIPLAAARRLRQSMKNVVDKLSTASRWAVRVVAQTDKTDVELNSIPKSVSTIEVACMVHPHG